MKRRPIEVPSVLGDAIAVKYVAGLKDTTGEEAMGFWRPGSRTIQIHTGLHPAAERQVLWHEWLHAVLCDTGVDVVLDPKHCEAVVDAVGTALARYAVFK